MSRALSVVLAVCCVLSMGIVGLPATDSPSPPTAVDPTQAESCVDDPNVGCVDNSSNYLSLNASDVVTISQNDTTLDVSTAVATDVEATTRSFSVEAFTNAYRATPREDRRAVVERYGNELENRTADLRERERDALRAYNDGDITAEEYLRTLAEIDAKADVLWELSFDVRNRWQAATGQRNRDPYAGVRADLFALRSPVRDEIQAAYSGDRERLQVHLTTTDTGFSLATYLADGTQQVYVRETYLGSVRRVSTGDDRYGDDIYDALDRVRTLYPWTLSSTNELPDLNGYGGAYRADKTHPQGRTTVFLDGQSGRVFADHQRSILDRLPVRYTAETNASNGLTVGLGQTHRGGPLNVTVTDETGERVPANVTIDGRPVGETGDDGELWTVTPYGNSFVVRAEHDGETVTIVRFARN
ncbi:DUF7096 domain-containing protein [Halomarina oriensis]|uniref:Uncharacterized protein n=1 Tax=Halomarina oriensis TaxID=671145 RepID=A0A6B0GRA3_9EURY|nr:hypothetical protein [Halomarina oriensis]MWG34645.1 hypothetical protein [Halomarina oriensis]